MSPSAPHQPALASAASDYRAMAQAEAKRPDGIDAVAIVSPNPLACQVPTIEDGLRGMQFIEAVVASNRAGGRWTAGRWTAVA